MNQWFIDPSSALLGFDPSTAKTSDQGIFVMQQIGQAQILGRITPRKFLLQCIRRGSTLLLGVCAFCGSMPAEAQQQSLANQAGVLPSSQQTYNTMDGVENGGDSFQTAGPVLANAVLSAELKGFILGIRLRVRLKVRDLGSFDVFVSNIADDGSFYSTRIVANVSDKMLTRNFQTVQVSFGDGPLAANKKYYIGIKRHPGARCSVILGNTLDPNVLKRREVIQSGYLYNKHGEQPNAKGPYEMAVFIR